ncbi:hypothetical protein A3A39_03865 [Candidatus Kaiserbacteria bacterium RIFCSPLOWO2_01_FULL_54_13]|uniref:Uncharacterized protein n=1 Tax=Candidatus Kaiserbacteria bacterium RIFCSPLOWO2_01_FULL_54_13 TaxID=1798512 RepID=A0A1F6F030_9BACT|nr:MAG: hypothetical protein A3A39_03865 [Candidatus Kaiserbacteria bacterium RIFCSPLOWO2_01_FULL_54_13]
MPKKESQYADLLRELDFEPWLEALDAPEFEDFKPDPPTFILFYLGETHVIDETGEHWRCKKEIDMSVYGFVDLMTLAQKEQKQSLLN